MKYRSTRNKTATAQTFSQALMKGLADDGGLFVPEHFPKLNLTSFTADQDLATTAVQLLQPFFEGDALQTQLPAICKAAFNFPAPLRWSGKQTVLELFHGPTCAFKDVGARFLAECVSRTLHDGRKQTVIVATSGDTGGAVAAAFAAHPEIEVYVLFPKGRISQRQEKQIACWGKSVKAFAVRGSFDDCQKMVKEALQSPEWRAKRSFISANSISIGRLLPQMTYYVQASLAYKKATGVSPDFVIPTGNLGNATAALWAKQMEFPIDRIVLATNANSAIHEYFAGGVWAPRKSIETLANAMDVGHPSNMERVLDLYPTLEALKRVVSTALATDEQIKIEILESFRTNREILCPHTATAFSANRQVGAQNSILVSTAHAAKFETIVEPLIGQQIPIPKVLAELLGRESHVTEIDANLQELAKL